MSNNLIRLSKSGIEYLDYVWNPISGCLHKEQGKCPPVPCWAEQITKRFSKRYPHGFTPTVYQKALISPLLLKKPSRIGVCFMGDLFGGWITGDRRTLDTSGRPWSTKVLTSVFKSVFTRCPQHTFILLTKNPAEMLNWGKFPPNCWVGYSAWSPKTYVDGLLNIVKVEAPVRFVSLEPLLEWNRYVPSKEFQLLDWAIIGALTGTKGEMEQAAEKYPELTPMKIQGNYWGLMPPTEWIENIVRACDACGVQLFLKDNLKPWLKWPIEYSWGYQNIRGTRILRQEYPVERS